MNVETCPTKATGLPKPDIQIVSAPGGPSVLKVAVDVGVAVRETVAVAVTVEARLGARGVPVALTKPFEISRANVAPPEKVGGNIVGGFIPYIIIILCFTGATC